MTELLLKKGFKYQRRIQQAGTSDVLQKDVFQKI